MQCGLGDNKTIYIFFLINPFINWRFGPRDLPVGSTPASCGLCKIDDGIIFHKQQTNISPVNRFSKARGGLQVWMLHLKTCYIITWTSHHPSTSPHARTHTREHHTRKRSCVGFNWRPLDSSAIRRGLNPPGRAGSAAVVRPITLICALQCPSTSRRAVGEKGHAKRTRGFHFTWTKTPRVER